LSSATITATKLRASKKSAEAMPQRLMIRPAGAGPIICDITVELCIRAFAGRICSGCTSVGINAGPAGKENASAMPKASVRT
jgi:hypothetical protein